MAGCAALLVAMAASMFLLGVAMHLYPGGTVIDPGSRGHSFWFNFLCDLTGEVARDGRPNHLGAAFARAALYAFAVAGLCFWLVLPTLFRDRGALSAATRIAGGLSALGFGAVLAAPSSAHELAVLATSVPGVAAGVLGVVGTVRYAGDRALALAAVGTLAAGTTDAVLYARSFTLHPRLVSPALPLCQRIALLFMLAWMLGTLARVLRGRRPPGPSRAG